MTDLAEFLLARIAERRALAEAAGRGEDPPAWNGSFLGTDGEVTTWRGDPVAKYADADEVAAYPLDIHVAMFISYNDPAYVLAECDANRRIVGEHTQRTTDYADAPAEQSCGRCGKYDEDPVPYPCPTLRLLALPYADHADYREEWRP